MANDYQSLLISAGLLPSEAKIYLAARELGPSTAQHIATKADISRTATYEAIESLRTRGLFSISTIGKRNLFVAEDPERIVSYLKKEQQRINTTIEDVTRSVEALRLISGGTRPTMRVYEGDEALHAYFDHVATVNPKEWLEVSNIDDIYSHINEKTLLEARRLLNTLSTKDIRLLYSGKLKNPRPGDKRRKISKEWGSFHGNIAIYGNFVAFATYIGKIVVVIIESPAISETMRTMFNMAWSAAKEE